MATENQTRLFETKGAVEAMLRAAQNGETNEIELYGVKALANLATAAENKTPLLFATRGVVGSHCGLFVC
jgi:hypothetical protein